MANPNELRAWRALAREWRERYERHAAEGLDDAEARGAAAYYERKIAETVD